MILIIDCGSTKTPFIGDAVDIVSDYKIVHQLDFQLKDLENISGVIISGAPILITEVDTEPYLQRFAWIKDFQLPVLGICFGHQIIGLLHGAFASRMKADRDWQSIDSFEESILLDKLPSSFRMVEDHCESISIPNGFQLVASSDACVNEMMQHFQKPLFGVQFHPEVSGNHGTVIIENFVHFCLNK